MHTNSTFSKTIFIFLFSISLALFPIQAKHADALWGEIPAQFLKTMLDKLRVKINGIIMGALKQAAIQTLNKSISGFVSGNGPETSKIITNYQDFLYKEPRQKTDLYLNDLLSETTGGQSSDNYTSFEGVGSPASGGAAYLSSMAKNTQESIKAQSTIMKPNYVGNPADNLFANGNMDNFNSYLSGINNPWAYNLYIQQKYQERLEQEREAAKTEALAGRGYKSVKQGGQIITPGALIETTMSNALDMGNKVLAGSTDPAEVITSIVQQLIMQTMQNGIGNAKTNIQKSSPNDSNNNAWTNPDTKQDYSSGGSTAEPWKNPDTGATYDSEGTAKPWTDPDTGQSL